jgi:hypothetical protein
MKTMKAQWIIGIVALMFLLTTSAWADGGRGNDRGDHGSKYQQRDKHDNGHQYKHHKHRDQDRRHYRKEYRRPMRHDARRSPYRPNVRVHRGELQPNPLFWLFPFPPLTPFTYR